MSTLLNLPVEQVLDQLRRVFEKSGITPQDAAAMADILLENEQEGYPSHGIMRASDYLNDIEKGSLDISSLPIVHRKSPLYTIVEGNAALGSKVIEALKNIIKDEQEQPVRFVAIKNAHHLGRLATLAKVFCAYGYIVNGFENYNGHGQKVMPKGTGQGRLATNPIVYGIPMQNDQPIILDMTTSIVSEGAVRQHHIQKQNVPVGWLVDAQGKSVQDTHLFYADPMLAFLSPLGGVAEHKGFGLSLMAEIFATAFSDAGNIARPHSAGGNSCFFILYKPSVFGLTAADLAVRIRAICDHATRGSDSVHVPGIRTGQRGMSLQVPEQIWLKLLKFTIN